MLRARLDPGTDLLSCRPVPAEPHLHVLARRQVLYLGGLPVQADPGARRYLRGHLHPGGLVGDDNDPVNAGHPRVQLDQRNGPGENPRGFGHHRSENGPGKLRGVDGHAARRHRLLLRTSGGGLAVHKYDDAPVLRQVRDAGVPRGDRSNLGLFCDQELQSHARQPRPHRKHAAREGRYDPGFCSCGYPRSGAASSQRVRIAEPVKGRRDPLSRTHADPIECFAQRDQMMHNVRLNERSELLLPSEPRGSGKRVFQAFDRLFGTLNEVRHQAVRAGICPDHRRNHLAHVWRPKTGRPIHRHGVADPVENRGPPVSDLHHHSYDVAVHRPGAQRQDKNPGPDQRAVGIAAGRGDYPVSLAHVARRQVARRGAQHRSGFDLQGHDSVIGGKPYGGSRVPGRDLQNRAEHRFRCPNTVRPRFRRPGNQQGAGEQQSSQHRRRNRATDRSHNFARLHHRLVISDAALQRSPVVPLNLVSPSLPLCYLVGSSALTSLHPAVKPRLAPSFPRFPPDRWRPPR